MAAFFAVLRRIDDLGWMTVDIATNLRVTRRLVQAAFNVMQEEEIKIEQKRWREKRDRGSEKRYRFEEHKMAEIT